MRRILIEGARHRRSLKAGGDQRRVELDGIEIPDGRSDEELLALDDALAELELHDAQAAQIVKLRYFGGLTHQDAADALGITRRAADRQWALARAWLYRQVGGE
jgi:RNA polymerase sigma factor (TIGR02999 family)